MVGTRQLARVRLDPGKPDAFQGGAEELHDRKEASHWTQYYPIHRREHRRRIAGERAVLEDDCRGAAGYRGISYCSRERQRAGRGGARELAEVPRRRADFGYHGKDPESPLLCRQLETSFEAYAAQGCPRSSCTGPLFKQAADLTGRRPEPLGPGVGGLCCRTFSTESVESGHSARRRNQEIHSSRVASLKTGPQRRLLYIHIYRKGRTAD